MLLAVIAVVAALAAAVYVWLTWHYNHWKNLGIPYVEPSLIFGNTKDILLGKANMGIVYADIYKKFPNAPVFGIYNLRQPQLVICNIKLLKSVLVKDFSSFHDNDFFVDKKVDPIIGLNPFFLKGEEWKAVRNIHTNKQGSGKIKQMHVMMEEVSNDMLKFIEKTQGENIDGKFFSGQYTADVVGSCVFGLKSNSFTNPDGEFRQASAKLFAPSAFVNLAVYSMAPQLASLFKLKFFKGDSIDYFIKIVQNMYDYRIQNNVSRNDFMGGLMEDNKKQATPVYSVQEITAHSLTFFFDGYETSSTLMSFILYLLAMYPDVQEKLRQEIDDAENLDYETIHGLAYLDAILNETLRMYPPGTVLTRLCTKDIVLNDGETDYHIKKGSTVIIPLYAIFNDAEHFPEPSTFRPERFYKQQHSPYFFPFGLGPRACPGSRFALSQVKTAIVRLVQSYRIKTLAENPTLPEVNPKSTILIAPKEILYVKFEKI